MINPAEETLGLKGLLDKIRAIADDSAAHVASGASKDYAEYQKGCGVIEGLKLAEREILDMSRKLEEM